MIYKIGSTVADVKSEFSDVTKKSELQIAMQQDSNTQEKISKPDEQTQKDLITETKFTKGIVLDRGLEGAGITKGETLPIPVTVVSYYTQSKRFST